MESVENISEYHSVFAQSIITTMNAMINDDEKEAKKLMRYMINYAYTQYKESTDVNLSCEAIQKEVEAMDLEKKNAQQLTTMMSYYQAKAKMKPVQVSDMKARVYNRIRGRI